VVWGKVASVNGIANPRQVGAACATRFQQEITELLRFPKGVDRPSVRRHQATSSRRLMTAVTNFWA
jgi:hypothetical protein